MKIIVVGCTHAGTATVVNLIRFYPNSEIVVYEKNDNISFLSCGIALSVSGVVKKTEKLFYNSPDNLKNLGIRANMNHEVIKFDFTNKKVIVRNLKSNEIFEDTYDKLVLTLGSWPIVPKINGVDLDNIILCKNYDHAKIINNKIKDVENIVIVGAGYIGVELAEAFQANGKNVTLIDAEQRIMAKYLDKEFSSIAEEEFRHNNVKLALGQYVTEFKGKDNKVNEVVTNKASYKADLVILSIGFAPNTSLVKDQLKVLPQNDGIVVDEYMRTSEKDVFAAGDCCVVRYNPAKDYRYIPLATNAIRMGFLVARNIEKPTIKYMGTQGTSGIKIYDKCIAATGLSEEMAKNSTDYSIDTITIHENNRPEFMPTYEDVMIKIIFNKETRQVIGGEILSNIDVTQFMNTLSIAIQNNMTIEELAMTDFFFQPHFNKPWNLLNSAVLNKI